VARTLRSALATTVCRSARGQPVLAAVPGEASRRQHGFVPKPTSGGRTVSLRMSTLGWILIVVLVLIVFGFISIRIF
jgi:hypothetical protein